MRKCNCYLNSDIETDYHTLGCPRHPRNVRIAKKVAQEKAAAQQKMHPTLLQARRKMITCPNCQTVFGVELPAPQSG